MNDPDERVHRAKVQKGSENRSFRPGTTGHFPAHECSPTQKLTKPNKNSRIFIELNS